MNALEEIIQDEIGPFSVNIPKSLHDAYKRAAIKYAKKAIKEDRINLLKYAKAKFEHMGTAGLRGIMVDNESILNAPILEAQGFEI